MASSWPWPRCEGVDGVSIDSMFEFLSFGLAKGIHLRCKRKQRRVVLQEVAAPTPFIYFRKLLMTTEYVTHHRDVIFKTKGQ